MKLRVRTVFAVWFTALVILGCVQAYNNWTPEEQPVGAMTKSEQCEFYNKWAVWPEHGECEQ